MFLITGAYADTGVFHVESDFTDPSSFFGTYSNSTISAEKGTRAGEVRFNVKDTGIGISTSDKKHLFEKFFRSEDYRTRESSGTGLGLHITKKLAEKIGGEVDVQSKLNSGSSFTLTVGSIKAK